MIAYKTHTKSSYEKQAVLIDGQKMGLLPIRPFNEKAGVAIGMRRVDQI